MIKQIGEISTGFKGKRITVELHPVVVDDGSHFNYEVVKVKSAVAILPILKEDGKEYAILLKHHRYPIGMEEPIWEVCAGVIGDKGAETHLVSAQRELLEETGYIAYKWTLLGYGFTSPGITNEAIHMYLAEGLTFKGQELEVSEQGMIKVEKVAKDDVLNMLQRGEIKDLKTIAILSRWLLHTIH